MGQTADSMQMFLIEINKQNVAIAPWYYKYYSFIFLYQCTWVIWKDRKSEK